MHAFEDLVAEFLRTENYWVLPSFRVELSPKQKKKIGRPTTPDWEIDIVAYRHQDNDLIAFECKSFLSSGGVTLAALEEVKGITKSRYKLFKERKLREVILKQVRDQLHKAGMCDHGPDARLALVAGKLRETDREGLRKRFEERGWEFKDGEWLIEKLERASIAKYRNHVAALVAKILISDEQKRALKKKYRSAG